MKTAFDTYLMDFDVQCEFAYTKSFLKCFIFNHTFAQAVRLIETEKNIFQFVQIL